MGTRSNIVYVDDDQYKGRRVVASYCHYDGYLDHTGRMLFDHYNSQKKAKELVDLGDMRAIKETPELVRENNSTPNAPKTYRTISSYMYRVDALSIEYIYMWDKNMWWVARSLAINTWDLGKFEEGYEQWVQYHSKFEPLAQELAQWDFDNPTDQQGQYV